MRPQVDLDLCQGHGICEMEAPEVFEAHRDHVEFRQTNPDESERDNIERAVQYCPTQALRIIED